MITAPAPTVNSATSLPRFAGLIRAESAREYAAGQLEETGRANNPLAPLEKLAARANDHHRQFLAHERSIEHARDCGRALIAAKHRCRRGRWLSWLRENFEGSYQFARTYMRVARGWPVIEEKLGDFAVFLNIDTALQVLGNKPVDLFGRAASCEFLDESVVGVADPNAIIRLLRELSDEAAAGDMEVCIG